MMIYSLPMTLPFEQEQAYMALLSMAQFRGTVSSKIMTCIKTAGGIERAASAISAPHTSLQIRELAQKLLDILDPLTPATLNLQQAANPLTLTPWNHPGEEILSMSSDMNQRIDSSLIFVNASSRSGNATSSLNHRQTPVSL